jgi:hypothetical protein
MQTMTAFGLFKIFFQYFQYSCLAPFLGFELNAKIWFIVAAAGVYLPEGRNPIIPLFQHSIIPVVSTANLSSYHIL